MKNVTITLEEAVARWARIRAAERNTRVSRLVGEMLREHMAADDRYSTAMERYCRGGIALSSPPPGTGGCGILLSEDLRDGQDHGGTLVVNPFRVAPEGASPA